MTFINMIRLIAVFVLSTSAFSVSAASVTLDFSGKLRQGGTGGNGIGFLQPNESFTGFYTFDSSVSATGNSTSSSAVFNNLIEAQLTFGNKFSASIGVGSGLARITQQNSTTSSDRYVLDGLNAVGSSLISGIYDITSFGFQLTNGNVFSDARDLLGLPLLASFSNQSFSMRFRGPIETTVNVLGNLESLTLRSSMLPEPSSLFYFIFAVFLCRLTYISRSNA
jgi:hypothetical protein